ncbi:hypothetical protein AB7Z98_04965 [Providencia manganoxydans]|uniref:hypothetical protein n=1 Tax=Providencia manganoxydans TaxID=2923283 RepID=UPI0034E53562
MMISTGLKQPTSVGFSADEFFITNGQVFVNAPCIVSGTIRSAKIKGPAIDDALRQAAEKGAREGVEKARFEITTGVNHNNEQLSSMAKLDDTDREIKETGATGILDRISETLHNSGNKAVIAALDKSIDINTPVSRNEFEEYKKRVETLFNELQSQLSHTQCALFDGEQATAQQLSDLQRQITELGKEIEEAKLKGSLNAINIISIKQTMEQQEKSLAETIKQMIAEDLCRGGTLSRML